MRFSWRHLLVLLLIGSAGLLACLPGSARALGEGSDDPEPTRGQSAHGLKAEWKAFHKLPIQEQERLRQIDEELHDEPPVVRARLWAVLERYTSWLERLDEKDRRRIESAPTTTKKLEIIKDLREQEWVAHLPKAQRDLLDKAAPKERTSLMEHLRHEERKRRADLQLALSQQSDVAPPRVAPRFWEQVRLYEEKTLLPTLTLAERIELQKGRRSWPEHARTLSKLADKYDPLVKVPPGEKIGVVFRWQVGLMNNPFALPGRRGGMHHMEGGRFNDLEGRWPEFALELDRQAKSGKIRLPAKPLGPCKPQEFVQPVRQLIDKLRKDPAAAKKLDEAQGKWPDYPFAVMALAKEKNEIVPGTVLPGEKAFWEQAAKRSQSDR